MILTIYCDICEHKLATAEREALQAPLTGAMFAPPESGYPAPFPAEAEWLYLLCPMCGYRAFTHSDQVDTKEAGRLSVPYGPQSAQPEINALQAQLQGEEGPTEEEHGDDGDGEPAVPLLQNPGPAPADGQEAGTQAALDAELLQLHRQGQRPGQIGQALGLTQQKVVGRLRVLNQR